MKKISLFILILFAVWTGYSCSDKKVDNTRSKNKGLLEITPDQFKAGRMALGILGPKMFENQVACKGQISAPANGMAKISTPIAGKVNSILHKTGDYINAGQVIATISGNDFMQLQQNFAEASASYAKAKVDFKRAQSLWDEKIGAEKDYLAAKSIFQSTFASYQSLKSRIEVLHLNPTKIENGQMYTSFPVTAPISGYITKVNAVIGQFLNMENDIAEIVNIHALQLTLSVFETDVRKLKPGQKATFGTTGTRNKEMLARLTNIGKTVNPETKTIDCIATIDKSVGIPLINDSYVEASITVDQKQVMALPVTAVQQQGNDSFVFVVEKMDGRNYLLKKTPVVVGTTEKGLIEIKSDLPDKELVVNGIENLP